MSYVLAIDQGTTGTRAFIFDKNVRPVASDYQEFRQFYPQPGWVEHDATQIWKSTRSVIAGALRKGRIPAKKIAAIGITNQRETTVLWERKTSRTVGRAIVWQCRRTIEMCQNLKRAGHEPLFKKITGLVLDPYFSGTKISWYLENFPALRERAKLGDVLFGTIDSWLIWNLTGGQSHVTDFTNASRTLCYDIFRKQWSAPLLKILKIPPAMLPEVRASSSLFGRTSRLGILPDGIPITGNAGDQQAALFGQGCVQPGTIKNTYGTGCFLLLNTGKRGIHSRKGFLTTLACGPGGAPCFALEGAVFIAGAAIQWLRDEMKLIKNASETEMIAGKMKGTDGVYLVPAFVGLGAPYWNAKARGIITGLTRGVGRNAVIRAALESLAYQTKDVVDTMQKELGKRFRVLKVDGGAAANNFLMQFQADILGMTIEKPRILETTARGAALLAGLGVRLYSSRQFNPSVGKRFKPRLGKAKKKELKELYQGWLHAVRQATAGTKLC
ncbi:MAG: glycerol kinase GlpK [Candidatus Omnitrophica bacterium]|nr:glycerol kinase GlpK [Candidatus Omnitrophota bacterium]